MAGAGGGMPREAGVLIDRFTLGVRTFPASIIAIDKDPKALIFAVVPALTGAILKLKGQGTFQVSLAGASDTIRQPRNAGVGSGCIDHRDREGPERPELRSGSSSS